jgi:AcrR family transcriptional regulator
MTNDSYDRIVEAATRLFAQKGYHGISMRDIAREVGLHVATVQQHVGSKEHLYEEVFRRQYEEDHRVIMTCLGEYPGWEIAMRKDADELRLFLKEVWRRLIARLEDTPELVRLWTYRWLERGELALDIDKKYSLSLYQIEVDALSGAEQNGVVISNRSQVLIWLSGFVWLQMGYFTGRNLISDLGEGDPFSRENLNEFYKFLDRYVDQMIDFKLPQS